VSDGRRFPKLSFFSPFHRWRSGNSSRSDPCPSHSDPVLCSKPNENPTSCSQVSCVLSLQFDTQSLPSALKRLPPPQREPVPPPSFRDISRLLFYAQRPALFPDNVWRSHAPFPPLKTRPLLSELFELPRTNCRENPFFLFFHPPFFVVLSLQRVRCSSSEGNYPPPFNHLGIFLFFSIRDLSTIGGFFFRGGGCDGESSQIVLIELTVAVFISLKKRLATLFLFVFLSRFPFMSLACQGFS